MQSPPRILIVEDERALALAFAAAARQAGAASELAASAAQARRLLRESAPFDALILDIGLPDENGLSFLSGLSEAERLPTIVVTAHGELDNTIAARKLGVREFFTKPLEFPAFHSALSTLLRTRDSPGRDESTENTVDGAFIGAAPSMRSVFRQIAQACASEDPVLIRGETGSGKSRVARLIREHSGRKDSPFLIHNAASAPLEEALSGSQGGVLVIENLSLLSGTDQALLLRGFETGADSFPRILATVSEDLGPALTSGSFRSDLYYRLQVLEVALPPLRERKEDLPALADFFSAQLSPERRTEIAPGALSRLGSHPWPGNLRELRNVVSYSLTSGAGSPILEERHLPVYLLDSRRFQDEEVKTGHLPESLRCPLREWIETRLREDPVPSYRELVESLETGLLRELLPRYGGRLARLAKELQANRATLRKRLQPPSSTRE